MTVVIITAGIDLSVGSVLGFVAVCFSLMSIHFGLPAWISIPFCLLIGGACGAASGTLIAWFKIQPFIATLAMMVFARGLGKYVSGGRKIATAVQNPDGTYRYVDLPQIFRAIDSQDSWGKPGYGDGHFCRLFSYRLDRGGKTSLGRQLFALGGNEEAARLSGVPVNWAKLMAYVTCGMLSAVAGICQAAQEQQGDPEAGATYELTAIAMVVIGGTSLAGGRGGIGLTLLGILTIGYLEKILSINAVPEAGRLMATGVIIILAVLTQGKRRK